MKLLKIFREVMSQNHWQRIQLKITIMDSNVFGKFYETENSCSSVTEKTIIEYALYLRQKDINEYTVGTYLRNIRVFFYYCMKLGYMERFDITIKKTYPELKDVYSDIEIQILLKKPNVKKCDFSEYRTWVITNFLLGTGVRLKTLQEMKIKDINFDSKQIMLRHVKNNTPYCIPLSDSLSAILKEYLRYRKGEIEDLLFCTIDGKQLKKTSVQSSIKRYNLRRGIIKSSVHLYRHTFVKHWLLSEGNIYELQKILGHKTLNMVITYANYYGIDLNKNFQKHDLLTSVSKSEKIKMKR